jgi:multidrug resistance efflux pump
MTWPGRLVPAARRVIEIDEVLAGEDRLRLHHAVELGKDAQLEIHVLGRRLDHQIAVASADVVGRRRDARHRRGLLGGAHLVLLDQAVQARADRIQAALHLRLADVHHHHVATRHGQRLGDAVARGRPTAMVVEVTTMPISDSVPCHASAARAPEKRPAE